MAVRALPLILLLFAGSLHSLDPGALHCFSSPNWYMEAVTVAAGRICGVECLSERVCRQFCVFDRDSHTAESRRASFFCVPECSSMRCQWNPVQPPELDPAECSEDGLQASGVPVWGEWGEWGACDCARQVHTRSRTCNDPTCCHGHPIDTQIQGCGVFSSWNYNCDCETRVEAMSRVCLDEPCEGCGALTSSRACNTVSHWTVEDCDCDAQMSTRSTRTCSAPDPDTCQRCGRILVGQSPCNQVSEWQCPVEIVGTRTRDCLPEGAENFCDVCGTSLQEDGVCMADIDIGFN